ncbi:hypothetical protein CN327_09950 [Bacillus cereus]|nr:hypothetical protein CN509_16790 [Bacillus cereus]PET08225.1 hypothetical protein CN505_06690 [Bacillus cereus]PFF34492.1 hypothetical protein CN327_09950 [Bacillus cereus]PFI48319.1 hypothetical protein COI73_12455 [Bacillus cereus]
MVNYVSVETTVYYYEVDEKHVYTNFMTVKESPEEARDILAPFYRDTMQETIDKHTSGGKVLDVTVKSISESWKLDTRVSISSITISNLVG